MLERGVYASADREAASWWFGARQRLLSHLLATHVRSVRPPVTILDVGCGTGANLPVLAQFGLVRGIEPDLAAAMVARERGWPVLPHALADHRGVYSVVVALDVLEHIADDGRALAQMRALLVPGGLAVISVPAYPSLWSHHDEALGHHRRYTERMLRERLEMVGFSVRYLTHWGLAILPGHYLARRVCRLNGTTDIPRVANGVLSVMIGVETTLLPRVSLPWGTSLVAVAKAT